MGCAEQAWQEKGQGPGNREPDAGLWAGVVSAPGERLQTLKEQMWEAREGVTAVLGKANAWQRQDLQLEGDGN